MNILEMHIAAYQTSTSCIRQSSQQVKAEWEISIRAANATFAGQGPTVALGRSEDVIRILLYDENDHVSEHFT